MDDDVSSDKTLRVVKTLISSCENLNEKKQTGTAGLHLRLWFVKAVAGCRA